MPYVSRSHRPFLPVAPLLMVGIFATSAHAQVADHLQCYKLKDPRPRVSYQATLEALSLAPGCTIKLPAKLVCSPATKTDVVPTEGSELIRTAKGIELGLELGTNGLVAKKGSCLGHHSAWCYQARLRAGGTGRMRSRQHARVRRQHRCL